MNRTVVKLLVAVLACALAVALALAGGCAKKPGAAKSGGMGMGGGPGLDESVPMGTGAIAKAGTASIGETMETTTGVMVKNVTSPAEGWLVARSILTTGPVLGATQIPAGTSKNVEVPVRFPDGNNIRVELRVDRGTPGMLDFDPLRAQRAADRVVVIGKKPVQRVVTLQDFGKETPSAEVSLWVENQAPKNGQLRLKQALVPREGWVVVRAVENGRPARIVGLRHITYEQFQFDVPLSEKPELVLVTLHEDVGKPNVFEFAMMNPFFSVDQPLTLGGRTYSQLVRLQ